MHGNFSAKYLAEVFTIARMVYISVGQDNKFQVSRFTAGLRQGFFNGAAGKSVAAIYHEKAVSGL
jgi:hypothetical protein